MFQLAITEKDIALLTKVHQTFELQYDQIPVGIEGKKLLTAQQKKLTEKQVGEKNSATFFADLVRSK